jgi:hypothetical protein
MTDNTGNKKCRRVQAGRHFYLAQARLIGNQP